MNENIIVSKAEYIGSAVNKAQYPIEDLPEFAFVGRSNVGKSSLINSLTRVKQLARVSAQPGKTQTINFYELIFKTTKTENIGNDTIHESVERKRAYLVDLPGYGYAKISKDNRLKWARFIEEYFLTSKRLAFVCLLLDIRHTPMQSDMEMLEWLIKSNIPLIIIATKSDKLSKNAQSKSIKSIRDKIGIKELNILPYSSKKNEGRSHLLDAMYEYLL